MRVAAARRSTFPPVFPGSGPCILNQIIVEAGVIERIAPVFLARDPEGESDSRAGEPADDPAKCVSPRHNLWHQGPNMTGLALAEASKPGARQGIALCHAATRSLRAGKSDVERVIPLLTASCKMRSCRQSGMELLTRHE